MDQLSVGTINQATTSGLLTTTGAETLWDTTVAVGFTIGGKMYSKAASANQATPTSDHTTGAAFTTLVGGNSVANTPGEGAVVVWGFQSDGTVKCMMGGKEKLDMDDNFVYAPNWPAIKGDVCPFAYTVFKAGATAAVSVIFGTTNWSAAGVSTVNVNRLPDRPVTA